MKLWLLNRIDNADYDEMQGFVIRAESGQRAREIANDNAGDENKSVLIQGSPNVWLNKYRTTCVELLPEGEEGVVLKDYLAG